MTEPLRHRQTWDQTDYEYFVIALRGLEDDEVANDTGRTVKSLRSRARYLLPQTPEGEESLSAGGALDLLRELLTDEPEYDWLTRVRWPARRDHQTRGRQAERTALGSHGLRPGRHAGPRVVAPQSTKAEAARNELIPSLEDDRDWREKWYWTIAQRVAGEGSIRDEVHGDFHP